MEPDKAGLRPTGVSATLHLNVESGSGQPFPGGVLARQVRQHLAGFFIYAGLTEAVTPAPKSYRLEIRPVKSDFEPIAISHVFEAVFAVRAASGAEHDGRPQGAEKTARG